MTDVAATSGRAEVAGFVAAWADSFSQVLAQIAGAAMPGSALEEAPAAITAPSEGDLWVLCTASGTVRGEMSLRLNAATALRLAQIFMSEPAAPEAQLTAEHGEAVIELLRQVAGLVASAIKPRWGETQLRLDRAAGAPSWSASSTQWLRLGDESPTSPLVELHLSAALAAALRPDPSASVSTTATPAASSPTTAAPSASAPGGSDSNSSGSGASSASPPGPDEKEGKLDLLMDVELAMTLRFGARRLLLREILELSPGAVVELDRQVEEPVDLLLDGRLVARGEVVVIDGNYGLRVTEILPPRAL